MALANVGDDSPLETDAQNVRDEDKGETDARNVRSARAGTGVSVGSPGGGSAPGGNVRDPDPPVDPVPNQAPIAVLTLVSAPILGESVTVSTDGTEDGDGTIHSGTLNWGDGTVVSFVGAPSTTYSHTYSAVGTYTITLTVIDNLFAGDAATALVVFTLANQPPVAALTFVSGEFAGAATTLSTTGTDDPDGSIASYSMNWGDGSSNDTGTTPPATLQHTYASAGTRTATFTVTDDGSPALQGSVSMSVTVITSAPGNPPTSSFSLSSGSLLGDTYVFAIDGSDPDAGTVTWSLDYGDGSAAVTGTGADLPTTRSYVYTATGSYTAIFRITDTESLTTTKTVAVTVSTPTPDPVPPVAFLTYVSGQYRGEPYVLGTAGTSVVDDTLASGSLNWGDGSSADTWTGEPAATYTHTYANAGTYTATLTVVSTTGQLTGTATRQVQIESRPAENQLPTANLTLVSGAFVNDTFVVSTVGTFDPDGALLGGSISWGDGTANTGFVGDPATSYTHVYTSTGTKAVLLTATDTQGVSATDSLNITVSALPSSGTYPYYDLLAARSDRYMTFPLGSQAELDTYKTGAAWAPAGTVFYDSAIGACQQYINPSVLLSNTPRQKHLPLVIPSGTTFLQTWDSYYESGFAWVNDGYFRTYKSYRWDCPKGAAAPIWIAMKHFFKEGTDHGGGALARFGVTAQNSAYVIAPTTYSSETPGPQTNFWLVAGRWVRTWVYYNATDQQLSVWVADSTQGVVQILNQIKYGFPSTGINIFRLEYDTSQNQFVSGNPLSKLWNRRMVVLSGLTYTTATSLLLTTGL